MKQVGGFKVSVKRLGSWKGMEPISASVPSKISLKPWQRRAFKAVHGARLRVVNAPTGSGKSILIKCLAAGDLAAGKKIVITVPQSVISEGLRSCVLEVPGLGEVEWHPGLFLCSPDEPDRVGKLLEFLEAPPSPVPGMRVAVCTHVAAATAFRRNPKAWIGTSVFIDEAHHCKNAETEDDEIVSNGMGGIVLQSLAEVASQLTLITATCFRGDRLAIIPDEYINRFKKFHLSYDEYLSSLRHLKEIHFNFIVGDPKEAISHCFRKKLVKSLVYIPHASRLRRDGRTKSGEVQSYLSAIGHTVSTCENVTTLRTKKGSDVRIVDLVEESMREEKKKAAMNGHADVIVALNMCKEGFDWPPAERALIIDLRSSLVEVIQILGRLLRDYPGKESVEMVMILPSRSADSDLKRKFDIYLGTILSSLMIEDILQPLRLPGRNWFVKECPDEAKRLQVLQDVFEVSSRRGDGLTSSDLKDDISRVLKKHGFGHQEAIRDYIVKLVSRRNLTSSKPSGDNPYRFLLDFTASIGIRTLSQIRDKMGVLQWNKIGRGPNSFLGFEECRTEAMKLVRLHAYKDRPSHSREGTSKEDFWHKNYRGIPGAPRNPNTVYEEQWQGWHHFFGFRVRGRASWEEHRKHAAWIVSKHGACSYPLWRKYRRKLLGSVARPDVVFKDRWVDWREFSGRPPKTPPPPPKDRVKHDPGPLLTFEQCRSAAFALRVASGHLRNTWHAVYSKIPGAPYNPHRVYKDQWMGWKHFLGVVKPQPSPKAEPHPRPIYLSFQECRRAAIELKKKLGWFSATAWLQFYETIPGAPKSPKDAYKREWISWPHFYGEKKRLPGPRLTLSFEACRTAAIELAFKHKDSGCRFWKDHYREIPGAPSDPQRRYAGVGWTNWADFFGGYRPPRYLPFEEAREKASALARQLGWFSKKMWKKHHHAVPTAPANPQDVYPEWVNWQHFFGNEDRSARA